MDKHIKAVSLAKAETLHGLAQLLRGMVDQTPRNYKALSEKLGLFIGEMEAMAKEWRDSTHSHLDRN